MVACSIVVGLYRPIRDVAAEVVASRRNPALADNLAVHRPLQPVKQSGTWPARSTTSTRVTDTPANFMNKQPAEGSSRLRARPFVLRKERIHGFLQPWAIQQRSIPISNPTTGTKNTLSPSAIK